MGTGPTRRPDGCCGQELAGLMARMIAEWMPDAASVVNVTEAPANPAAASPARYSARDRAPAMQPTYEPAAARSAGVRRS